MFAMAALQPDKLDGLLALRDLVVDDRSVGSFTVDAPRQRKRS